MAKLNKLGVKNSLWNNIRANRGSGRKPTAEMLRQERKIRSEYADGGPVYNWIPPIYPRVGARYEQGGWLDQYANGGSIEDQRIPTPAQYEFGLKYADNNTPMMTANQMGTRRSTLPDGKIVDSSPEIPAYSKGGPTNNGKRTITKREDFEPWWNWASRKAGDVDERQDAFGKLGDLYAYYAGQPLHYNVLEYSQYKPTNAKNSNATYISINDPKFKQEVFEKYKKVFLENQLQKDWTGEVPETKINDNTYAVSGYSKATPDQLKKARETKTGVHLIKGKDHVSNAIGRYFISKGKDEKGDYISYYDTFDEGSGPDGGGIGETLKLTKPFEIYGRIYLDPKTGKPKLQNGGPVKYAHGATVFTKQTTPTWVAGTPTPTTTQREIAFNRSFSPGTAVPYPEVKIPASAYTPASPPVLQGYNPYSGPMRLHAPDTTRMANGGRVTEKYKKRAGIPYAISPGVSNAGMYVGPTTQRGITFANGGWLDTYATGEEETQAGPTLSAAAALATKPYFNPAVVQSILATADKPVTTTTGRVISTPASREKERREKVIAKDPSKYSIEDYKKGIQEPETKYVPVESIFLPGTPVVKGLGKVGNVLLDAANPLSGISSIKSTAPKTIVEKASAPDPFQILDEIIPSAPHPLKLVLPVEGMSMMGASPLNYIPGYGKKIAEKGKLFRYFGNTLEDVKARKALSPKGGAGFRMGKEQIINEGNWAELNAPNNTYERVFMAVADPKAPGSNLGYSVIPDRNGVLITDAQGNRLIDIPISDPGLSFKRRLPFTKNRFVDIDKQKLLENKFQLAAAAPHLQSLAEKYVRFIPYAAATGTLGPYLNYTINPVIREVKERYEDLQKNNKSKQKKNGGWLDNL